MGKFENRLKELREKAGYSQQELAERLQVSRSRIGMYEQGMPFDVVSGRLDELSGQKIALQKAIAELEIQKGFKLTKDHIQFFLEQFRSMDASDRNCEKRLISVFVNAIYVYDDKLKIAFNYSEEGQRNTVSLHDVECSHVVHSPTLCRMHTNTLSWVKCVFIINVKIAP